ncbi:MAG: branched-chain amino acid ABC transporter substrate-binding protein [Alphaproteobacteria bacterium]|nr:MAG: branched-chain amino acid ABC transporter substrate-binding protein [Alphaproteobacteria bacterium]
MRTAIKALATAAAAALALAGGAQAQQGVTDTEVRIGSNGDLSGIFAPFNVQAIKAAQMEIDKVNAAGGIHGRKIKLIVEDHGYQMPKAMANFNKLLNSDKVFAMILNLGTPMNLAGLKLMTAKKVANISPLTAARQLLDPPIDYKYVGGSSYYDQMKAGVEYLAKEKGVKKLCGMYIPSDFGKDVIAGAKDKGAELGLTWAAETTHKPDEGDFVGALSKLREAGCDLIATALGVRQTIIAVATAKKLGWTDVTFLGSSAAYHEAIAQQPGGITDGYYAAASWADYHPRMDNPVVKKWHDEFVARYNEEPGMAAILGYGAAITLIRALEAAGPDLTPETFRKGMESLNFYDPIGDIQVTYGPNDHRGGDLIVISVVKDGAFHEVARR